MGLNPDSANYQRCALAKLFEFCGSMSLSIWWIFKNLSHRDYRELTIGNFPECEKKLLHNTCKIFVKKNV